MGLCLSNLPEKGASVPFSRRTRNCSRSPLAWWIDDAEWKDGEDIPLLRTARHSSLDFSTGNDILEESDELKRDPRNGMVGIDLRIVARVSGCKARFGVGSRRLVVGSRRLVELLKV